MALSDRRIFELWSKRQTIKARVAKASKLASAIDQKIIAEFQRRGISSLTDEVTGQTVTKAQAEHLVWNPDELLKRLRRARKFDVIERITYTAVDMSAVAAEYQAGNIPPKIAAACSELKQNAPYVTGSRQ